MVRRPKRAANRKQPEAPWQAVIEGLADAVFVKDVRGRYLMINTAGARFVGKTVQEVVGKTDRALFRTATAASKREADRRILATGATETQEETVTAAGIARNYLITKGPYRNAAGDVLGIFGIVRDTTAGKALASERDRLLERLRLHIDRLPLACISMDAGYRIVDWNPAAERIFGYTQAEALGRVFLEMVESGPSESIDKVMRLIGSGSMNADSVNQNRTKDGRMITCHWFNTPLVDADGKFTGVISLAQDVTERARVQRERARLHHKVSMNRNQLRRLSRQLFEAQELERRKVARELHDEIGQVLTAVVLSLRQLKSVAESAFQDQLDENLSIVQRAIHQVRDLSLDLRPPMLDDLGLIAALRWHLDRLQGHGCRITFKAPAADTPLPSEIGTACFRVAQEAVTNALRHAHAAQVLVELRHSENEVKLTVRDDGIGFDPTEVRRRAAAGGSFGVLGMQERVQLLGGRIKITSSPGHGAEIRVRLPVRRADEARTRRKGAVSPSPARARSSGGSLATSAAGRQAGGVTRVPHPTSTPRGLVRDTSRRSWTSD